VSSTRVPSGPDAIDHEGRGTLVQPRLYQLLREPGSITERTFEIAFLEAGVEAYVFTFG
jgi:Thioredoxin like C-terminal domain